MKRFVLAGAVALAAVTTMTAANAADIAAPSCNAGEGADVCRALQLDRLLCRYQRRRRLGHGRSWSAATGSNSFDTSGGVVGGTLGYNWQMNQVVFGLEGDLDWSNIRGSTAAVPCTTSCETRNDWLGTARGRIGYAFDRWMPYVTGGLAFGNVKASPAGFGGDNETEPAGRSAAVSRSRSPARGAPRSNISTPISASPIAARKLRASTDVDFHTSLVRGGINYRF